MPDRPVFGVDRDPGVLMEQAGIPRKSGVPASNPMVVAFGPGPEGKICGDCVHLIRVGGHARDYVKCEERGISQSVATDHRVRWPSCGRFTDA